MSYLPKTESNPITENVWFASGENKLHGLLSYPEDANPHTAVVFAGPHPLLGGNMNNNVVKNICEGLALHFYAALRFDYPGVGQSEGSAINLPQRMAEFWKTSHITGEESFSCDLQAALGFLKNLGQSLPLAIIAYSFGCSLLPLLTLPEQVYAAVLIAPTITKHDYSNFKAFKLPILVVTSEDDFANDNSCLDTWYDSLIMPRKRISRRCDNHFFRGHEEWLLQNVLEFLSSPTR
jgi:alpha/beta superfamily hydrolase